MRRPAGSGTALPRQTYGVGEKPVPGTAEHVLCWWDGDVGAVRVLWGWSEANALLIAERCRIRFVPCRALNLPPELTRACGEGAKAAAHHPVTTAGVPVSTN